MPHPRAFRALLALLVCAAAVASGRGARADSQEVRALWVTRATLASRPGIDAMIRAARDHGFNAIFVQVRGRGDAYYAHGVEPRAADLAADLAAEPNRFDPLAEVIAGAHAAGLRVHAWVNVNLIASASELPADRTHVLYRHPEWLMVPRALAAQLAPFEANNPGYVGAISRWTRGQAGLVEGLYTSPIVPGAVDHIVSIVSDVASRYDVDGVHLDYARYPADTFDYSRSAVAAFRADAAPGLPEAARRALDEHATVDPLAWPDGLQDRWRQFRRARLTALVIRIRTALKAARPSAVLSAAVAPDLNEALQDRLQDWRTWIEAGILDAVCPMAYTQEAAIFTTQIAAAREAAGHRALWAGIGAYRLTPAQTLDHIRAARRAGATGVALFSYDSLTAPPAPPDYLATVARGAFGADAPATVGADRR